MWEIILLDSKNDITKVRVDQNVTSIKVTPVPEDSKSTVTVNGQEFSAKSNNCKS